MKLLKCKVLLPILCTLAILLSVFGSVMVSGSQNMPWRDGQELTELDKILERDGYLEGIMFPWFTHQFLGNGLTGNDVLSQADGRGESSSWNKVGIEQLGVTTLYREIYNLKALGFNIMGYEGSPYGEGVVYDANGDVLGIKDEYLNNLRIFLDICREVGMPIAWTVTFHSTTLNDYYDYGKNAWDVIAQSYANPVVADHYAERFVKPLCDVLNEYPDVVVLMVSSVELENEINDSAIGNHFDQRLLYGTNQDNMLYFIKAVTDMVKQEMPNVARTLASNAKDMTIYEGIDFDMFGVNHYTISAKAPSIADLKATKPMLCTEFGFGDKYSSYKDNPDRVEDEIWTLKQVAFRNDFIEKGYKGWFHWCWSSTGYGGGYDLLAHDGQSPTDFRAGAFAIKYNADNYRAAHRGEEIIIDKPVLFCNTGSGRVEWISSRQAYALTIERSYDGGKTWKVIAENLDPVEYEKNFKGTYVDEEVANCTTGGTVCYRITADDGWGEIAVSEPNNVAEILGPPINVFGDLNCSFENGMADWTDFGTNAAVTGTEEGAQYYAAAVKLDDATDGEYALEIKFLDGSGWNGIHIDGIDVKENANYVISYDYKIANPEKEFMTGYFFIRSFVGDGSGQGTALGDIHDDVVASKWLNNGVRDKWTTEEISFKTNATKLGLDLRAYLDNHYYIDNIEMYEVR